MTHCKGCGVSIPPSTRGPERLWCSEQCRKAQYAGVCSDCGGPTNGTTPGRGLPLRCAGCQATRNLDRNERIIELWEAGWTAEQIAPELNGMSPTAVRSWINNARQRDGLPISLHRLRDREAWDYIQGRWNEDGATASTIARELGISVGSVKEQIQTMRRLGIDVERRGRDWKRKAAA